MQDKTFLDQFERLLPDCTKGAGQTWVNFATECVDMGQTVDFEHVTNKTEAIDKWLDTIYTWLHYVKQEFGAEVAGQISNIAHSQKHALYPWEMKPAAEYLANGGDINNVVELSVDGEFDAPIGYLKTTEMLIEQNFNQIDGIINNQELPRVKAEPDECRDTRPSIRAQLKENVAQTATTHTAKERKKDMQER